MENKLTATEMLTIRHNQHKYFCFVNLLQYCAKKLFRLAVSLRKRLHTTL